MMIDVQLGKAIFLWAIEGIVVQHDGLIVAIVRMAKYGLHK